MITEEAANKGGGKEKGRDLQQRREVSSFKNLNAYVRCFHEEKETKERLMITKNKKHLFFKRQDDFRRK